MSARDKAERLAAAVADHERAYNAYLDAAIAAAYRLQALLDLPDDPYTRETARNANADVIRTRAAWTAAMDVWEAINKEAQ